MCWTSSSHNICVPEKKNVSVLTDHFFEEKISLFDPITSITQDVINKYLYFIYWYFYYNDISSIPVSFLNIFLLTL